MRISDIYSILNTYQVIWIFLTFVFTDIFNTIFRIIFLLGKQVLEGPERSQTIHSNFPC